MPHRYAVLLDKSSEALRPIGIAIEHPAGVIVDLPVSYGVPMEHVGEYRVLQPDLTEVIYRPGDQGYLEQVLVDLYWGFAMGEVGQLDELTQASYARLHARVMADYDQQRSGSYASTALGHRHIEYEAAEVAEMPQRAANQRDLALAS